MRGEGGWGGTRTTEEPPHRLAALRGGAGGLPARPPSQPLSCIPMSPAPRLRLEWRGRGGGGRGEDGGGGSVAHYTSQREINKETSERE